MESRIKLGRIFGFEIGLHHSWIIIAILIAILIADRLQEMNSDWGPGVVWITAIITGVLFFATIVAHELSHALVARRCGLPVRSITLFLFGVARIEKDPPDARSEFWIGLVGPLISAGIGFLCLGLAWELGWSLMSVPGTPLLTLLVWLGYINLSLAVFNLIPAFPMNGGRMLHGIIWWMTGSAMTATRIVASVGILIALTCILAGILTLFQGDNLNGFWIALVGWFLLITSRAGYARQQMNEKLRSLQVGDVMARNCPIVDSRTNLDTFVDEYLLQSTDRYFLVAENDRVAGLITPREVRTVKRAQWPYTTLGDVMLPFDRLQSVDPEMPVSEMLDLVEWGDSKLLLVTVNGRFQGLVSRDRVFHFLLTQAELNK